MKITKETLIYIEDGAGEKAEITLIDGTKLTGILGTISEDPLGVTFTKSDGELIGLGLRHIKSIIYGSAA